MGQASPSRQSVRRHTALSLCVTLASSADTAHVREPNIPWTYGALIPTAGLSAVSRLRTDKRKSSVPTKTSGELAVSVPQRRKWLSRKHQA